ncbi:hypothetical protein MKW94_021962 [Papaver nudicaule]|uniref:DUF8039 domain-containing protein n=1 Tax=Papaver nudicaule TaxID=74823 RepID=A0AA41VNQ8_PAPNU|nr:hypothetical protein [Papaver nudicaule]
MEDLKIKGEFSFNKLERSFLWKKARENKKGVITHDATKERAKAIDELTEQVNEGSLVTSGSGDILTLALGIAEHSGNVRGMGKFVSQGAYFNTARPKMKEEREARLKVEAELHQTKERLALVEKQLSLVLQTQGRNAPTCDSTNARSSSESHERISRLEAQLAMFLMNQGAEASVTTKQNNSAVSKPTSSAASSPKVFKDGEDKGEAQSNLHVGLGKGKSCKLYLEGSSIVVATGKVFRTRSSDVLHGNAIGKGNVRVCLEVPLKPRSRLPIPLKAEEEI